MKKAILIFSLPILMAASCKKTPAAQDELSKLPPVTQTGAKTFGCLVNGKVWIPENGNIILTSPPLRFYYDNINGGEFSIIAQRSISKDNIDQEVIFAVSNIATIRNFIWPTNSSNMGMKFNNYKNTSSCITLFSVNSDVQTSGNIIITRFDLPQGIISGTFEFTLSKQGCETINITNGRFDGKL